jgi:hypothetical protein
MMPSASDRVHCRGDGRHIRTLPVRPVKHHLCASRDFLGVAELWMDRRSTTPANAR